MKTIKQKLITGMVAMMMMVTGVGASMMMTTPSVSAGPDCEKPLLTFPVWFRGLTKPNNCDLKSPTSFATSSSKDAGIGTFISIIALNVIEMILQLIGYLSAFFIIYGGFTYMTQAGDSSKIVAARKTITNAVAGLVISMLSIAIVNLIFGILA